MGTDVHASLQARVFQQVFAMGPIQQNYAAVFQIPQGDVAALALGEFSWEYCITMITIIT